MRLLLAVASGDWSFFPGVPMAADLFIHNIGTLLTVSGGPVESAAVLVRDGVVSWCGLEADCPRIPSGVESLDAEGGLVTPGLVECHTHLIYAGSRADEYEARALGVSYQSIAGRGGGIQRTVEAVREASIDTLVELAVPRALAMFRSGITTIEIKSGYGLTLQDEIKILEAAGRIQNHVPVTVVRTFLGAHAIPAGTADRTAHVDAIVSEWIPEVASRGLATFCDVFCETVAFTVAESRRIMSSAIEHGMRVKIHADQLSASGASALAAEFGAVSADHLDHSSDRDIAAMAAAGVTGVLLPGCPVSMCRPEWLNARRFIDGGMKVALSTDFNPGSSVTSNLLLMGTFGMSFMKMSATEVWRSITADAASALGLPPVFGTVGPGAPADMVVFDCVDFREPFYNYATDHVAAVIKAGTVRIRHHGG